MQSPSWEEDRTGETVKKTLAQTLIIHIFLECHNSPFTANYECCSRRYVFFSLNSRNSVSSRSSSSIKFLNYCRSHSLLFSLIRPPLFWPISVNVYCVSNSIIHGTLNGIALEIHNTVFVLSSLSFFCQRYKRLCRVYYDKQLNRTPFAILANVEWTNNRDDERISAFNRVNRAFGSERQLIYPKFELNEPNGMAHTHIHECI